MRLFWEVSQLSFRLQLAYRAATLAMLLSNVFWGLLRAFVFIALFDAREEVAGISIAGAITYSGLSQALIGYLLIFGWYDLMGTVHSGAIGTDLLKPISFFIYWLSKDLGRAIGELLLRGIPTMLIFALIFDVVMPTTVTQWIAFGLSLMLSWLVMFSWHFMINLAAFWTPNARGVARVGYAVVALLSGFTMPLRFFPDWFITLANLTPFPHIVNTSVEIYLEILKGAAVWLALGQQILWAAILIGLGQIILRIGVRRLVIQGG